MLRDRTIYNRTEQFQYVDGSFNYRPYQLLLSVGVIVFAANSFMLRKNLAVGKNICVSHLLSYFDWHLQSSTHTDSNCLLITDILIDLVLLLLSISAFIATIVTLNAPIEFNFIYKVHDKNNPDYDYTTNYRYYETLQTFFLNFSDCLQSNDPTIPICVSSYTILMSMVSTYASLHITFHDYIEKLRVESKRKVGNEAEFQGMLAPDPTAV